MVRMASEDIGLAEPGALAMTLAAKDAFDFLGVPEGLLALAQAVVYLSLAPKSNAVYLAAGQVDGSGAGAAAYAEGADGVDEKFGIWRRLYESA
jgi:replication-associated recombination protein RarA